MPQLEILVGPIASGKSTYCALRAAGGAIIVNDDNIVMCFHANDYKQYNKKIKGFYKSIEIHAIILALNLGLDVVIDRPCFKRSTRQRYIELAKTLDIITTIVSFKRYNPEIHGQRRFTADNRGQPLEYWMDVAKVHDSQWEEPNQIIERFDRLIIIPSYD